MAPDSTDGWQTLTTTLVIVACILGLLSVSVFLPLVPGAGVDTGGTGTGTDAGATTPPTTAEPGDVRNGETRTTGQPTTTQRDSPKNDSGGGVGGGGELGPINRDAPLNIVTRGPVIPGSDVTIQVLKGRVPVGGVTVYVAGSAVGRTNQFGRITVRVPLKESFDVRVRRPANRTDVRDATEAAAGGLPSERSARRHAIARPTQEMLAVPQPTSSENATISTTVTAETDATITFQRTPRLGHRVQLTVQSDTTPIPDAVVRVNGDTVGRTGPHGTLVVKIPLAENTTVTAKRGPISATRTLHFDGLTIGVEPRVLPFLVAGQGTVITVTQSGEPIANAPVYLDGEQIGVTNEWGQTTAELPVAGGVTVRATNGAFTTTRQVGGLFGPIWNALLALGVFVGLGVVVRRRHGSFRSALEWLIEGGRSSLVLILVGLARVVNSVLDRLLAILRQLREADRAELGDLLREALTKIRTKITALLRVLRARGETLVTTLNTKIARSTQTSTETAERTAATATPSSPNDYLTIRDAWDTAVEPLSETQFRTKTPAEIGAQLIDRGDPPEQVRTIVDAFRDVEYGNRSPDDYVAAVERAASSLKRARSQTESEAETETTATGTEAEK